MNTKNLYIKNKKKYLQYKKLHIVSGNKYNGGSGDNSNYYVLMIKSKERKSYEFPGGNIDPSDKQMDGTPEQIIQNVSRREFYEETGLDLDINSKIDILNPKSISGRFNTITTINNPTKDLKRHSFNHTDNKPENECIPTSKWEDSAISISKDEPKSNFARWFKLSDVGRTDRGIMWSGVSVLGHVTKVREYDSSKPHEKIELPITKFSHSAIAVIIDEQKITTQPTQSAQHIPYRQSAKNMCQFPSCDKPTYDGKPGFCSKTHRDMAQGPKCQFPGCDCPTYNGRPGFCSIRHRDMARVEKTKTKK